MWAYNRRIKFYVKILSRWENIVRKPNGKVIFGLTLYIILFKSEF